MDDRTHRTGLSYDFPARSGEKEPLAEGGRPLVSGEGRIAIPFDELSELELDCARLFLMACTDTRGKDPNDKQNNGTVGVDVSKDYLDAHQLIDSANRPFRQQQNRGSTCSAKKPSKPGRRFAFKP